MACGISVSRPGIECDPGSEKYGVLTIGPPGNSQNVAFWIVIFGQCSVIPWSVIQVARINSFFLFNFWVVFPTLDMP